MGWDGMGQRKERREEERKERGEEMYKERAGMAKQS